MEKGSRYALSALKRKRASLAAEIVQLERQVQSRKDSLGHVDACLRLLDPSFPVEAIPNKRIVKHVTLFRQGELGRLILGALLKADGKPERIGSSLISLLPFDQPRNGDQNDEASDHHQPPKPPAH
jgi:hypothetical protein